MSAARRTAAETLLAPLGLEAAELDGLLARAPDGETTAGEWCLAQLCLERHPGAVELLRARYWSVVDKSLQARKLAGDAVEELSAQLFEAVVFGRAGVPAKLAQYDGRGALAGWLGAAATRFAIDAHRRDGRHVSVDDEVGELVHGGTGAELELLKRRFTESFRSAFREALAALEPKERLLLKQRYVDGVPVATLAQLHQAHRASISRWLSEAHEHLLGGLKDRLQQSLGIPRDEANEVLALIHSRLDLSLGVLMKG